MKFQSFTNCILAGLCQTPSLDFVGAPGRTIEWLPADPSLSRTAPAGDSVRSNTFDCIFKP